MVTAKYTDDDGVEVTETIGVATHLPQPGEMPAMLREHVVRSWGEYDWATAEFLDNELGKYSGFDWVESPLYAGVVPLARARQRGELVTV